FWILSNSISRYYLPLSVQTNPLEKAVMFNNINPLYLITDRTLSGLSHVEMVREALDAGIRTVQLREKRMPKNAVFREALKVRQISARKKALFIINDYLDIALAVKADGVHLGQSDLPVEEARRVAGKDIIIGISTHNLRQAKAAQKGGADYIGFGPLFPTSTKDAGLPRGIEKLRELKKHITIPIAAIGGIGVENINAVMENGADACAVISGILHGNIKENIKQYLNAFRQ
ncbi:MAG: thiamine phosphate synthase, partial [Nitrospiraceae bacterium]